MECEAKTETQHARDIRADAKARPYKNLPLMILIDEFWLQDTSGPQKKRRRDAGATKENAPRGSGRSFLSVLVYHEIKFRQGKSFAFLQFFWSFVFSEIEGAPC